MPITSEHDEEKFFILTKNGKATTLYSLIVIEVMNVLFAVNSASAI